MRILYLSASVVPSQTANSIQVMRMCDAFAANGHDVLLLAYDGAKESAADVSLGDDFAHYGVQPRFQIRKRPLGRLPFIRTYTDARFVLRTLKSGPRPDLIYGRHLTNIAIALTTGLPAMLEMHDVPRTRQASVALSWLVRQPNFLRLITNSDALRRELVRRFPFLPESKQMVAQNAGDESVLEHSGAVPHVALNRSGALQVGYVGQLYAGRGIELIFGLAERLPHMDFHIVGGTPEDLEQHCSQASAPNIHFYGFVPPATVGAYLAQFDVVLAPYQEQVMVAGGRSDTARWMCPLKLFDYMSMGKAIVCSDLPVLREVLTDGETALLVPPRDVTAWVQALTHLYESPSRRAELGAAARRRFLARHTWKMRAMSVLDGLSLEQIVKRESRPA